MKKIRKLTAALLTGIILVGASVNAYAVTPQYRPPQTDFTIEEIVDAVKDYLKDNPIDIDISGAKMDKPKITQAIYYHKKLFYSKARLQVRWGEIPESDYYEIKITKTNGESKVYETSNTSLFVYNGSDEFIKDCVRSGKVEVKAVKDNAKSDWSDAVTISCNSLHR